MFKLVEHTADVALEISAESLESLFLETAAGFKAMVLEDSAILSETSRKVELAASELEDLLVQWLSELNYFITVHYWLANEVAEFSLQFSEAENEWKLQAEITGEPLDHDRHYIYFDIKAVTYHQMKITQTDGQFSTKVVFDI